MGSKVSYLPTSIYRLVSPGGFFRVEEFTDLFDLLNDVFEQFYCGCGYVSTVNEKGKYTKF